MRKKKLDTTYISSDKRRLNNLHFDSNSVRKNLNNFIDGTKKIVNQKTKNHPIFNKAMRFFYGTTKRFIIYITHMKNTSNQKLERKAIKKISYVPYIGTRLKSEVFTDRYINNWTYKLKEKTQKAGIMLETNDVMNVKDADAVIFFDNMYYKNLPLMWDLYYHKKLHRTVYIDYEPPTGHCRNHSDKGIKNLTEIFKTVITYNDSLVTHNNIVKGCIGDNWGDTITYKKNFKERKFIAMITNNTDINGIISILNYYNSSDYFDSRKIKPHKKQIYSKREEAAKYFMNKCPNDFDLYGAKWPSNYNLVTKKHLPREEKTRTISQYKYILSYDSIINQRGYISEKIFDIFKAKAIPIYWGADNVTDYIPKDCFIDKRDFETYDDLYNYLTNMTEKEYNKRIAAIEGYLESEQYSRLFSSEASANIIYNALMTNRSDFSYKGAYKMLKKLQKQKNKVDAHKSILGYTEIDHTEQGTVHMKFIYIDLTNNDLEFVVEKNGIPITITNYKKRTVNHGGAYEHSFIVVIEDFAYFDKVRVYIRNNDILKKLRIKECKKGYYASMNLKTSKRKFSISRRAVLMK